ncbi:MAG: Rpn family recombination-promoting nuclease/putative transposase [Prevotellaceae bacterium]|jgi:predicted transposase/invertase (TIGR01784 family)|nr:Rpn family recombination-promoting nuclease/putative transposase [Prevotellaceae bacterium]
MNTEKSKDMQEKNASKERPLVSFDWAVKRMLRSKANFEVVEGFLSELLESRITITSVLESKSNMAHPMDKSGCVNVVVEDASGELILIEIQFITEIDYLQRMLYGVSKSIVEHIVQENEYEKIRKIFSINIVYSDLGPGEDYVYYGRTDFRGIHESDTLLLTKKQQDIFGKIGIGELFVEYYVLSINKFDDITKNTLDEWVYFLKNDRIPDSFTAQGLLKARDILDYSRLSQEERAEYDYAQKVKSQRISQIATAKEEEKTEGEEKSAGVAEEQRKVIKEKDKTRE